MVLAYAIIGLIILALLLQRDLSRIGHLSFKGGLWLLIMVVGLFVVQALFVLYQPGQNVWQMILLILSQLALLLILMLNRSMPGIKLFALGIVLNLVVMVANGGWMPITPETYQFVYPGQDAPLYTRPFSSKNIVLPQAETKFWILSDMIPLSLPGDRTAISIGDIFLVVGIGQFVFLVTSPQKDIAPYL